MNRTSPRRRRASAWAWLRRSASLPRRALGRRRRAWPVDGEDRREREGRKRTPKTRVTRSEVKLIRTSRESRSGPAPVEHLLSGKNLPSVRPPLHAPGSLPACIHPSRPPPFSALPRLNGRGCSRAERASCHALASSHQSQVPRRCGRRALLGLLREDHTQRRRDCRRRELLPVGSHVASRRLQRWSSLPCCAAPGSSPARSW